MLTQKGKYKWDYIWFEEKKGKYKCKYTQVDKKWRIQIKIQIIRLVFANTNTVCDKYLYSYSGVTNELGEREMNRQPETETDTKCDQ